MVKPKQKWVGAEAPTQVAVPLHVSWRNKNDYVVI